MLCLVRGRVEQLETLVDRWLGIEGLVYFIPGVGLAGVTAESNCDGSVGGGLTVLLPFFQWFYPRSCLGCGVERPQAFRFLCWECWSLVKRVELPYCDRCGDPVVGAVEHAYICYFCADRTIVYDRARSRCAVWRRDRRGDSRAKISVGILADSGFSGDFVSASSG